MIAWIGVALLSVSWLLGQSYYRQADWQAWTILVVAGTVLLTKRAARFPSRRESAVALVLALPALALAQWPYRAAPLLIVLGLALHVLPVPRRGTRRISAGAVVAGCALLVQSLAMIAYEMLTAKSHDLPSPLPQLIGGMARLLGVEVAVHETTLAMHSMRKEHMLGATWELLLDPATLCFVAGGSVLLFWDHWVNSPRENRSRRLLRSIVTFFLLLVVWLPLRAALLMSLYLHDVLRTEYDAALASMKLFWNPWVHLVFLAPLVVLAWRFLPAPLTGPIDSTASVPWKSKRIVAAALVFAGAALLTVALFWDPVGRRMAGRVIVEEYHPQRDKIWEPTYKPFDTTWYGNLSGYNYYCMYDYCSHFYTMSRLTKPIDDGALRECDVLVIKVPTRPYAEAEIGSIRRFVDRGGGLLLIGEHTNVFGSSTYLNAISRSFGFTFREDCLFGIESVFEQRYEIPLVPHPILQDMPPLDFATSCSVDPGESHGRAVMRAAGLKNLMADYHADNFYPQPIDLAEMRYGAFVQMWSMRYGRGRVVAFTDSTIFSNFSIFEPGKSELMLGMIEWLNHSSQLPNPRPWLTVLGLLMLFGGLLAARAWEGGWLVLIASGLLGWATAVSGVQAAHRLAMPVPPRLRPMFEVVLDRTVCDAPLPKNGFIDGKDDGFGIFERWILRLGYFTSRRQGPDVFGGDLVVFPYASRAATDAFRESLITYVAEGGRILFVDSPQNTRSTANSLLRPFGMVVDRSAKLGGGQLTTRERGSTVPVADAFAITGGQPFVWLKGHPVGAHLEHGKGSVTVVGFGSRFTDANMGVTGDVIPGDELKKVYDLLFSMLRTIIEGAANSAPATSAVENGRGVPKKNSMP